MIYNVAISSQFITNVVKIKRLFRGANTRTWENSVYGKLQRAVRYVIIHYLLLMVSSRIYWEGICCVCSKLIGLIVYVSHEFIM